MTRSRTLLKMLSGRFCVDLLLVLSVFLLPWWLILLSACLFFFVFDRFVELFLLALLIDLLYGNATPHFGNSAFALSLLSVPLSVVLTVVRQRMRF